MQETNFTYIGNSQKNNRSIILDWSPISYVPKFNHSIKPPKGYKTEIKRNGELEIKFTPIQHTSNKIYELEEVLKIENPTHIFLKSLSSTNIDMEPILLKNKTYIEETFNHEFVMFLCMRDALRKISRENPKYFVMMCDFYELDFDLDPLTKHSFPFKVSIESFYNDTRKHFV
jgi:hypothetical protein